MPSKPRKRKPSPREPDDNIVVISDTHIGSGVALCHPDGFERDEGGTYMPSKSQLTLWEMWREFWDEWVPKVTLGEPYKVVHVGDVIDGAHHGSVQPVTNNLVDQGAHAEKILRPVVELCGGRYYQLRGTEAHSGKSAQQEELVAKNIRAIREKGMPRRARDELWMRVGGERGGLVHFMHHVGTTSSSAYESSAPMRELTEAFVEAGRWGDEPPRVVVRAHRHRHLQIRIPSEKGDAIVVTTPAWQMKTPFTFKIAGARQSQPQIGGIIVRYHKGELYIRNKVWRLKRPDAVKTR
jgi:hypothetical protein